MSFFSLWSNCSKKPSFQIRWCSAWGVTFNYDIFTSMDTQHRGRWLVLGCSGRPLHLWCSRCLHGKTDISCVCCALLSVSAGAIRLLCVPQVPPAWVGRVVCVSQWTLTVDEQSAKGRSNRSFVSVGTRLLTRNQPKYWPTGSVASVGMALV